MIRFYLLPIVEVQLPSGIVARGPKYFNWKFGSGLMNDWNIFDYGFVPYCLLATPDINQVDHDALAANADVYAFPENLDAPVSDPTIDAFFEGIHIPTDWLTPSTSYRELLRSVSGMFQFNQAYGGASGVRASLFDAVSLGDRINALSTEQRGWFDQALVDLKLPPVGGNPQIRQLVRQAASLWEGQTFYLGRVSF